MLAKDIFHNALIMAPLAGFSDIAMRQISIENGADFAVTEMISAKGLMYSSSNTQYMLRTAANEKIRAVQIFGSDPDCMAEVVANSVYLQDFDIIDINMGCPVPKIVRSNEGSALMRDIGLAEKIVAKVRRATSKILTVKMRIGWDESSINAVEFARMLEDNGVEAIAVHGRTSRQMYAGVCNYHVIGKVREQANIPIIANGDIVDWASYKHVVAVTGCDSVMIGRGGIGSNIWESIRRNKSSGSDNASTDDDTWRPHKRLLYHLDLLVRYFGDTYAIGNVRKLVPYYLHGVAGSRSIRASVNEATSVQSIIDIISCHA